MRQRKKRLRSKLGAEAGSLIGRYLFRAQATSILHSNSDVATEMIGKEVNRNLSD